MSNPPHRLPPLEDDSVPRENDSSQPTLLMRDRVIVFARFPEPGRVKTRLIPALGPEGAAQLQTIMTRRTLDVVRRFCAGRSCDVDVRFAGGDLASLRRLFGDEHHYSEQQGNSLGERLEHAVSIAFEQGIKRVLVIGTDCPEMRPSVLQAALDSLSDADVVIGPAIDGGYYLIGLRANRRELFREIDWGTENVLRQTLDNTHRLQCSVRLLTTLSDIDDPEDLTACRQALEAFVDVLPDELVRWYSLSPTRNSQ